ncbi:MAG: hypothetical protein PHI28_14090 [Mangrovibacterium sp.]|nr:hypothetical protein [Mangrovibacterium sp.]
MKKIIPNLSIQAAHFGNPWYEEAAEAARRNENLFYREPCFRPNET